MSFFLAPVIGGTMAALRGRAEMAAQPVLAAVDFSDITARVLEITGQLANRFEAPAHLLHAVKRRLGEYAGGAGLGMEPVLSSVALPSDEERQERARTRLQQLCSNVALQGVSAETSVGWGNPVDCILEAADDLSAGWIVLGSHGHGALYEMLVGSVTEGVLRRAPCPVVVVPAGQRLQAATVGDEASPGVIAAEQKTPAG